MNVFCAFCEWALLLILGAVRVVPLAFYISFACILRMSGPLPSLLSPSTELSGLAGQSGAQRAALRWGCWVLSPESGLSRSVLASVCRQFVLFLVKGRGRMSCGHVLFEEEGGMGATQGRCYLVWENSVGRSMCLKLGFPCCLSPGSLGQKELCLPSVHFFEGISRW